MDKELIEELKTDWEQKGYCPKCHGKIKIKNNGLEFRWKCLNPDCNIHDFDYAGAGNNGWIPGTPGIGGQ